MEERFPVDLSRILVAGHSNGGIFSWYLACADISPRLTAFAPVNGTLVRDWRGDCDGVQPRFNLLHTHGALDTVVPLEGRNPEDGSWSTLGAEETMLSLLADENGREIEDSAVPPFQVRRWVRCNRRYAYEIAVFEGGHNVPRAWPDFALDWFEALEQR